MKSDFFTLMGSRTGRKYFTAARILNITQPTLSRQPKN